MDSPFNPPLPLSSLEPWDNFLGFARNNPIATVLFFSPFSFPLLAVFHTRFPPFFPSPHTRRSDRVSSFFPLSLRLVSREIIAMPVLRVPLSHRANAAVILSFCLVMVWVDNSLNHSVLPPPLVIHQLFRSPLSPPLFSCGEIWTDSFLSVAISHASRKGCRIAQCFSPLLRLNLKLQLKVASHFFFFHTNRPALCFSVIFST